MENFTPIQSTVGGTLIGLSAALLLLGIGRVAGISGIFAGVIEPRAGEFGWRATFLGGLLVGGALMFALTPELYAVTIERSLAVVAVAGVLVGVGTRLGSGCTSGHGVCGMARLSTRSLMATISFMATGALTVYIINHLLGGSL